MYHVTRTSSVKNIQKKGIIPLQKSNWCNGHGERYGDGEIFACETFIDAVKWAAKMDWEFFQSMGSGQVSIVEFQDADPWDVDNADEFSQLGNKGKWLKKHGSVKPDQIGEVQSLTVEVLKANPLY